MARVLAFVLAFTWSFGAGAAGLAYAVQPLEKAKAAAKAEGKHLLVFYTSPD